MKVLNSNSEVINIEFTAIELHILNKAMSLYNRKAFQLTNNINHAEAVEKLDDKICEAWCGMPASVDLLNKEYNFGK